MSKSTLKSSGKKIIIEEKKGVSKAARKQNRPSNFYRFI